MAWWLPAEPVQPSSQAWRGACAEVLGFLPGSSFSLAHFTRSSLASLWSSEHSHLHICPLPLSGQGSRPRRCRLPPSLAGALDGALVLACQTHTPSCVCPELHSLPPATRFTSFLGWGFCLAFLIWHLHPLLTLSGGLGYLPLTLTPPPSNTHTCTACTPSQWLQIPFV